MDLAVLLSTLQYEISEVRRTSAHGSEARLAVSAFRHAILMFNPPSMLYPASRGPGFGEDPRSAVLKSVIFERLQGDYDNIALIFAGSANSLRSFETWSMAHGEIDVLTNYRKRPTPGQSDSEGTSQPEMRNHHKHGNSGERVLQKAAQKKGVYISVASGDLEYKVEEAQRRAGFAASRILAG
ncbi:hypothetical protein BDZ45DRAFT_807451 [Acephala macrosclerotiorum]|nr:hypothetical protein BDZ45DRAFT_807451 [Acephala macrosclerotiorum]